MTLLDVQRVVSRILTDQAFYRSWVAGDEATRAPYELSARELRSLEGLRWDRVGQHVHLLAHGRLDMALKALPRTQQLMHDHLHEHMERFCREHPPVPVADSPVYVEASRMNEFVARLVHEGLLRPAWIAEVAEFELAGLRLSIMNEAVAGAAAVVDANAAMGATIDALSDAVPFTGAHVHVGSFRYPLLDILATLDDGQVPGEVTPGDQPLMILFQKVPGIHQAQTMKINSATAALLEWCDGTRRVRDVLDLVAQRFGSGAQQRAVTALDQLRAAGVLGVREPATRTDVPACVG